MSPPQVILESLGCTLTAPPSSIIDLRPPTTTTTSNADADDDRTFLHTLLAESRDAAIESYGSASFCVGNVADDTDVEDVGLLLPPEGAEGGNAWDALVERLGIDLASVRHLIRRLSTTTNPLGYND